MLTNTIAAISTGGSNSGINIIRVSGEKSLDIINKIFNNSKKLDHQKIIYGKIIDDTKTIIDEVLVSYFKAPNSYTGEDVCEINCHGGKRITEEILELVLKHGARIAEPGEFSKIAFLNGKMDLSKAEGIIDMINARTSLQTRLAANQLKGNLKNCIEKEKEKLVELIANIEVNIDYPEYEYEELKPNIVKKVLSNVIAELKKYIKDYNNGKYVKDGIDVAILGGTNAGKSSLINMLAKEDVAIVTDIEGTTRDIVKETVILNDIVLNIADTAGIRETEDKIEQIGIEKSIAIIDKVDLIIYIIDVTKGLKEKDIEMINQFKEKSKKYIICINKIDVSCEKLESIKAKINEPSNLIETSFIDGQGINTLEQKIALKFKYEDISQKSELIIVNERHKDLILKAIEYLNNAIQEIDKKYDLDIAEMNIKEALDNLNEIIGNNTSEDIIDKIFKKFCLGK